MSTIGNHVIIKDRVIVKGHGYIVNYTRIFGDLVINGEDVDFDCSVSISEKLEQQRLCVCSLWFRKISVCQNRRPFLW